MKRGPWILATRAGAEPDLIDELEAAVGPGTARIEVPGIVRADRLPTFTEGDLDVTFARQAFVTSGGARGSIARIGEALAREVVERISSETRCTLLPFSPDTAEGNRLGGAIDELVRSTLAAVRALRADAPANASRRPTPGEREGITIQVALLDGERAVWGMEPSPGVFSRFPGGRARMKVRADAPARSARKLAEALAWFGVGPEPGELCVDLGAAPGGWTHLVLSRGARVVAIDPGRMDPDLTGRRGLVQLRASAFDHEPEEPADWLLCDMAFRPLDVAKLVTKWGRRRWARMLVANFKLPMAEKAAMVTRIRAIVTEGGWQRVRTRQLYHDRDEITLLAHL